MTSGKYLTLAGCLAVAAAGALIACRNGSVAGTARTAHVDYNWDVRPILSENCFRCHGPDAKGRKAGLRLDLPDGAYAELEKSPGKHAIVPGNADKSELVRRITATDPDERMPPQSSHKELTAKQIETLKQWVEDGAQYKQHWAFIPPERPAVPQPAAGSTAINDIDRFVLADLARQNLKPSPEASQENLIGRVSLTLTGLPPTLKEVDAFVADKSPDAYEKLVDRLLASDAHAEHLSNYWLDLARWSESDGFLFDHHDRVLWPWRDWVISAFKRNMPFDRFVTWQLAGDLLPNPTREQRLATAYLRIGKRTTENGVIEPEYKAEYMIERTDNALGVALMGLTLGCARCHDHKYDPISQVNYYSFGAFFNMIDEPGFYAPGHSAIQGGPTLPWPSKEQLEKLTGIGSELGRAQAAYDAARRNAEARVAQSMPDKAGIGARVNKALKEQLAAYYSFDSVRPATLQELPLLPLRNVPPKELVSQPAYQMARTKESPQSAYAPDRRIPQKYTLSKTSFSDASAGGVRPAIIQEAILEPGHKGKALFINETNKGYFDPTVGWYDRGHPFSFDLWFNAAKEYADIVPVFNYRDDDNSGGAGYRVQLEEGKLWFYIAHSRPANMIAIRTEQKFPTHRWVHLTLTYDGSSTAAGTKIYLDGVEAPVFVDHDHLTRSILPMGYSAALDRHYGLQFGVQFREKSPVGSALDEFRVYGKALSALEVWALQDPAAPLTEDAGSQRVRDFLVANDEEVKAKLAALTVVRERQNDAATLVPQVLVMGDAPRPQATYVLNRGVYDQHGQQVTPHGMDNLLRWDPSLPANRLGLARWLMDPKHPLTARVFVNRLWQNHFGMGLVKTANDFGSQGSIPSHPELLDWLARELIESGWDVRHIERLIVTSATYRQSSAASATLVERDPDNTWLARGPRWRMTAEMIRDSALRESGLLVNQLGGPSAYPYQPPGVWNEGNSAYTYPDDDAVPADEHHRRTMYTFIKRTAVHPFLNIFDFPDRNASAASRRRSNTPLQALALMNSPQFIEASRVLATHVMTEVPADADQEMLTRIYRMLARRTPTAEQLALLTDYFRLQVAEYAKRPDECKALLSIGVTPLGTQPTPRLAALTNVASLIMNSPDAFTVW